MKKPLTLVMLLTILALSSCSSIEKATDKWKTPEAPNAGLAEGEKSNYLGGNSSQTDNKEAAKDSSSTVKKKKAKKTKKTTK